MTTGAMLAPPEDVSFWEEDDFDTSTADESLFERIVPKRSIQESAERMTFELLADELAAATLGMSSTRRASRHPAYQEILALGESSIPYLVDRLDDELDRPIWLRLLGSLTSLQPGAGKDTVAEAADAWMRWSKSRGQSA